MQKKLRNYLPFLSMQLLEKLERTSGIKTFPAGTTILQAETYVKAIPIVLKGLVKVFIQYEDRELLLYYIQAKESCVVSFSAGIQGSLSTAFAITEEETEILLLPVEQLEDIRREYPEINRLFFEQYNHRYLDLLDSLRHLLFDKMDIRLYHYLQEKARLTKHNPLKLTHRQIANEMGTAREVISRLLKKLEKEGKVQISTTGIKVQMR